MAPRISGTPGTVGAEPSPNLPATALETTPENPWPVSLLSQNIKNYIDRMSVVWVEGQIIEFNPRGRASYLTIRDLNDQVSLPVQVFSDVLDRLGTPIKAGDHVVVQLKANFWLKAGRLSMQARDIRHVGLGELLARLERLKRMLASEGLFDPALKKPIPFLPTKVGLITGRNSDAEKDVIRNATLRWPSVQFDIINTAVQGTGAVTQVIAALEELDGKPDVDVIIIARGGGSLEDLLPFSNESLIRAVAAARTPVVSAIGHEADHPILDEVADLRASTPTDAAKRVVPDFHQEVMGIMHARAVLTGTLERFITNEQRGLDSVRSRPVLANPHTMITTRADEIADWRTRATSLARRALHHGEATIEHLRTQVRALSPLNTLARGYAIVQDASGVAVRNTNDLNAGDQLTVTVEHGAFDATVTTVHPQRPDTPQPKDTP